MNDMLNNLGKIIDLSEIFATTYKQFDEGTLLDLSDEVIADIKKDKSFQERFKSTRSSMSFDKMIEEDNGGTDFLFSGLTTNCENARLQIERIKQDHIEEINFKINKLFALITPSDTDDESEKSRLFQICLEHIDIPNREIDEDSLLEICQTVKQLTSVSEESIPRLQTNMGMQRGAIRNFIETVISEVSEEKDSLDFNALGFQDESQFNKFKMFFYHSINKNALIEWFNTNFGSIQNESDLFPLKRYIAIAVEKVLLYDSIIGEEVAPPTADTILSSLQKYQEYEKNQIIGIDDQKHSSSPHFDAIITPFADKLRRIQDDASLKIEAVSFPGDAEAMQIKENFYNKG